MLMPRYYFAEDFRPFQDYFLSQPGRAAVGAGAPL